jgi:hypothetical protein
MPDPKPGKVRLPPRWFIQLAWVVHRRLYRWTGVWLDVEFSGFTRTPDPSCALPPSDTPGPPQTKDSTGSCGRRVFWP